MPWARSTPLFYYNKEHYADAGLPDRAPETWAEMKEFAGKLTAAGHEYLDQIETALFSLAQGVAGGHDAQLPALLVNDAHLARA